MFLHLLCYGAKIDDRIVRNPQERRDWIAHPDPQRNKFPVISGERIHVESCICVGKSTSSDCVQSVHNSFLLMTNRNIFAGHFVASVITVGRRKENGISIGLLK